MLKVSSKGRYALRLMLDLAHHAEDGVVPLKEIASRQHIPLKYLELIIALLLTAGIVRRVRGPPVGCRLSRNPSDVTAFGDN